MRTLLNKTFLTGASALSILSLLLVAPLSVSAQETIEERTGETDFTETVEIETNDVDQDVMNSSDMEMDSDVNEMDVEDADIDEMGVEDADIESDIDYSDDDDSDIEAESYSNSPRALW
ncbi:MAG: hypothetical protein AAFO83_04095 [Cyanobacteria bacterium J06607_13]